jgi:hypothetical protein
MKILGGVSFATGTSAPRPPPRWAFSPWSGDRQLRSARSARDAVYRKRQGGVETDAFSLEMPPKGSVPLACLLLN